MRNINNYLSHLNGSRDQIYPHFFSIVVNYVFQYQPEILNGVILILIIFILLVHVNTSYCETCTSPPSPLPTEIKFPESSSFFFYHCLSVSSDFHNKKLLTEFLKQQLFACSFGDQSKIKVLADLVSGQGFPPGLYLVAS